MVSYGTFWPTWSWTRPADCSAVLASSSAARVTLPPDGIVIALRPANLPRLDETTLDGTVLAFTAILALVTGVVFGLLPALQLSRPDVTGVLKDGGRTGTAGRSRQLARRQGDQQAP